MGLIGTGLNGGEYLEVTGGRREGLSEGGSEDGDSVSELWVEGGANSSRSPASGGVPSDVVSAVQIFIRFFVG